MKIIGIIAEYNPFHLGHKYRIDKIKEIYKDSIIIAIVSSCFTERGDISILNKWDKTKICLDNDIDLVIELPTLYSTQSADIFAKYALKILNELKINILAFGSETNDIELLKRMAEIQLYNKEYDELVKKYIDEGMNYPTATSKALNKLCNNKIEKPNDLLALSYIKEIIKNKYEITPLSIKREDNYHSKKTINKYASANLIRTMYQNNENIRELIPKDTEKYYYKVSMESCYKYLKYKIESENDISNYLSIEEGIDKRIKKYISESKSWNELVSNVKTKRYTYNRVNRILLHILLNIKKEDNNKEPYIKILGFNSKGRTHLNNIKKKTNLRIFTKYKSNTNEVLDIENTCTKIYSIVVNDNELIKKEYKQKPIIK